MQMDMPMMGQKGKNDHHPGERRRMWQISEMGPQPQIMKVNAAVVASNTMNLIGVKYNPLDQMDPTQTLGSDQRPVRLPKSRMRGN